MTYPVPTKEQVKEWVRESNHNESMFYQVACMAAEWSYEQANPDPVVNKTNHVYP